MESEEHDYLKTMCVARYIYRPCTKPRAHKMIEKELEINSRKCRVSDSPVLLIHPKDPSQQLDFILVHILVVIFVNANCPEAVPNRLQHKFRSLEFLL